MCHWLWGCADVFIKRQPCSRALETDPICSRPGWVVKISSKCGPQGLHPRTPPGPLSLHLQHLCLIAEGGEPGANAHHHRGGVVGDVGPQRWWRQHPGSDPVEVKLPGCVSRSHEHTPRAAVGWGVWTQTTTGMLPCVLFSFSSMCCWSGTPGTSRSCILFLSSGASSQHVSQERFAGSESEALLSAADNHLTLAQCERLFVLFPVCCYTCAAHVTRADSSMWVWNVKLDDDGDEVDECL